MPPPNNFFLINNMLIGGAPFFSFRFKKHWN